jgi:hypothetical protein
MQRQTWTGIFTATVFAIGGVVMAQSQASTPQSPSATQNPPSTTAPATPAPSTAAPQTAGANRVTVTGCLREAPAGSTATGTAGSSAPSATDATGKTASGEEKFVLANAAPSPNPSAAETQATKPQTYRLIANDSALSPHVGKKVELTGTVEGQEASATANAQPGGPATASASVEPRLRVESGKVVGADCTP